MGHDAAFELNPHIPEGANVGVWRRCGELLGVYSPLFSTSRVVATFKDDLAGYEIRTGTIRFPLSQTVPVCGRSVALHERTDDSLPVLRCQSRV